MTPSRFVSLLVSSFLVACGGGGSDSGTPPSPTPPQAPYASCSPAGVAASVASTAARTVCMLTSQGEIVVELYADKAAITVTNFLQYVSAKRYDNTLYHRVVAGFVIQGGLFTWQRQPVAAYPAIVLESNNGLSNTRGTLAMARTGVPNSATNSFFINTVDNSACLNYGSTVMNCDPNGYAVFGKVIAGLDVVDKIAAVAVDVNALPRQDVYTYWAQQLK